MEDILCMFMVSVFLVTIIIIVSLKFVIFLFSYTSTDFCHENDLDVSVHASSICKYLEEMHQDLFDSIIDKKEKVDFVMICICHSVLLLVF